MWIVLIVFALLVLFSAGSPGYHIQKPTFFNPFKPVRCIVLTVIFILLGVGGGYLLYQDFGKVWLIPLLAYMGGAVPGMFLYNANGRGADGRPSGAWFLLAPVLRYVISLFTYPIKTIKCFFGHNWDDPIIH